MIKSTDPLAPETTDVAIIGAGPVGLFAVFELGLYDMRSTVIDVLDRPGGQCVELYPEKPIYDIPGLPVVTGQELTNNLLAQIKPFGPQFLLGQTVTQIEKTDTGFVLRTERDQTILAKVVVIAAGGGLFSPKTLPLPEAPSYLGTSLFYAVRDRAALKGQDVVIAGGGDSALDWALNLIGHARSVTLTHRRDEFRAAPQSVSRMRGHVATGQMKLVIGPLNQITGPAPHLTDVTIGDHRIPASRLLVFYGLTMQSGPLAQFGVPLENDLIPVGTHDFQTSIPGIFAIGDICTYPGKLKLILSGFHESALMAKAAFSLVHPTRKFRFQYTTTASDLHEKLGVTGT
jgi:thioredoxin reductase (NADPH)